MKKYYLKIIALFLIAFGLITLFTSSSVIFDLFDIRIEKGNYVLFVVWTNFICSLIYIYSAYGFFTNKKWTTTLLGIAVIILLTSFVGLNIYANSGGIYETKTMSAMIFRTVITLVFAFLAYFLVTKRKINI